MKSRNKNYFEKQKAFRKMIAFKDIRSFLFSSFKVTNSLVVKNDIVKLLEEMKHKPCNSFATAS
jgi:hypothetical protein